MGDDLKFELERELKAMPLFANISEKCLNLLVSAIVTGEKADKRENWRARYANWSPGEVLAQQGTFASDFHVLLKGVVRCSRTEANGSVLDLGYIRAGNPGHWLGEMPALSNQAHYARYVSETPCTTLAIEAPGFKRLYGEDDKDLDQDNPNPKFKEVIDSVYQDRALFFHLRVAPLLKGLEPRDIARIAAGAQLRTAARGEVVAEQGKPADAVFLIRNGIIKCIVREKEGGKEVERYHAALCDNSSFGERALTSERQWPARYVAMTRTDLVRLPRELFEEVFGVSPTLGALRATATHIVERETSLTTSGGKHLVKAADVLVIDLHKCTRCNACIESCVAVHDDGVPRLSKRGLVNEERSEMLTSACYHCRSPDCMMSCNYGAIRRTLQGEIDFIYDACTGCKKCESSCPYGVIRMADKLELPMLQPPARAVKEEARPAPEASLPAEVSSGGRLSRFLGLILRGLPSRGKSAAPGEGKEKMGLKAIKCDFCAGMPYEACVYNCPCGAIRRVDPRELDFEPARMR